MASNPLIDQGVLNRLRASLTFAGAPALNVSASYLGKDGISIALEGPTTLAIDTQTGVVQSPEPFVKVRIQAHLLRTQALASAYKAQIESNCVVGNLTVRGDSSTLPDYTFVNCAITSSPSLSFNGTSPDFLVEMTGIYYVNNQLWNI